MIGRKRFRGLGKYKDGEGSKSTVRHPNLVALELSSFKCGHDAPIYTVVQEIVECSGTPYFSFKDIDENKPTGSIRIRVETISYFLERPRLKTSFTCEVELNLTAEIAETAEGEYSSAFSAPSAVNLGR